MEGIEYRDILVGVLAGGAVAAGLHPALDIAAKACEPLFAEYPPDDRTWYPRISPTHARAAIAYASRAFQTVALTREEFDWVCVKANMAIKHDFTLLAFPGSRSDLSFNSEPDNVA